MPTKVSFLNWLFARRNESDLARWAFNNLNWNGLKINLRNLAAEEGRLEEFNELSIAYTNHNSGTKNKVERQKVEFKPKPSQAFPV
jgi:hypothetical protein